MGYQRRTISNAITKAGGSDHLLPMAIIGSDTGGDKHLVVGGNLLVETVKPGSIDQRGNIIKFPNSAFPGVYEKNWDPRTKTFDRSLYFSRLANTIDGLPSRINYSLLNSFLGKEHPEIDHFYCHPTNKSARRMPAVMPFSEVAPFAVRFLHRQIANTFGRNVKTIGVSYLRIGPDESLVVFYDPYQVGHLVESKPLRSIGGLACTFANMKYSIASVHLPWSLENAQQKLASVLEEYDRNKSPLLCLGDHNRNPSDLGGLLHTWGAKGPTSLACTSVGNGTWNGMSGKHTDGSNKDYDGISCLPKTLALGVQMLKVGHYSLPIEGASTARLTYTGNPDMDWFLKRMADEYATKASERVLTELHEVCVNYIAHMNACAARYT